MSKSSDHTIPWRFLGAAGNGPHSELFAATIGEQRVLAVKRLTTRSSRDVDRLLAVRDAIPRWSSLRELRLVPTESVVHIGSSLGLIRPWVDGLDINTVLLHLPQGVPPKAALTIISEIAGVLAVVRAHLGEQHRDLSSSNVLLTREGQVRITDFGTGYTALAGRQARAGALTKGVIRFLSPHRRMGKRDSASDIYALGVLTLELLRGLPQRRAPERNPDHDRAFAELLANLPDFLQSSDEAAFRSLVLRMVAFDEHARPEPVEVVSRLSALLRRMEGPSLAQVAASHWAMAVLDPFSLHPSTAPTDTITELTNEDLVHRPGLEVIPSVPIHIQSTDETTGQWIGTAFLAASTDATPTNSSQPSIPRIHGMVSVPSSKARRSWRTLGGLLIMATLIVAILFGVLIVVALFVY